MGMKAHQLGVVTATGSPIDDPEILMLLPSELSDMLHETNGFILFQGGLHVRGAIKSPTWHSLRHSMQGKYALHNLYTNVKVLDIPFAQDCMGDQYLLRETKVLRLLAETGELEEVAISLSIFWDSVRTDPLEFLNFSSDLNLEPGQLLHAYPPFCTEISSKGYSLYPVPAKELISFHADLARQIGGLQDGDKFRVEMSKS